LRSAAALTKALTRYRLLAYATGVLLLLLTLHVILKYGFDSNGLGVWVPIAHGWLYLVYVVFAIDLWQRSRLPLGRMVLVALAGTVPAMSFVAERWVTARMRPIIEAQQAAERAAQRATER
jgi:integral membrane protein